MVARLKRAGDERLIKKYPNRRLYDTQTSAYVTLADIKDLVMANEAFKVVDAKTDDDLTRNILMQIILEEEALGEPVFSSQMLSQIIRFYGHSMHAQDQITAISIFAGTQATRHNHFTVLGQGFTNCT